MVPGCAVACRAQAVAPRAVPESAPPKNAIRPDCARANSQKPIQAVEELCAAALAQCQPAGEHADGYTEDCGGECHAASLIGG